MSSDFDVVIVGAGASGLAALSELSRAGCRVLCVEARDRIGGRIYTVHDSDCPLPVELGAEFIHGRPPETWQLVRSAQLPVYDCEGKSVLVVDGRFEDGAKEPEEGFWADLSKQASGESDQTFADFLDARRVSGTERTQALSFVEGFNAADAKRIGIQSLAEDTRASAAIEGDTAFRFVRGYDDMPQTLLASVNNPAGKLRLNTAVSAIEWQPGSAVLYAATGKINTACVLSTLPLGVLQARGPEPGAVRWHPRPERHLDAANQLAFGQVVRIVCHFHDPFWTDLPHLRDAGFIISDDPHFQAWWSTLTVHSPMLTAWSAGPRACALLGLPERKLIELTLESLSRISGIAVAKLEGLLRKAYRHDWASDPFARGAYSYVPAGALQARRTLAEPLENTLFFSGEATELEGHSATVHGAIAAGRAAAKRVLSALAGTRL